ncbi:diiron oxygenase [Actinocorallia sp. API 0066]|uniref:diiron oxygenase n=1 Tax=Actinocorallia sp. API 0066 TaxID=2896846 RepID=UPI001E52F7FC|nr:diiron oxygenase [Actinocorallia sp. API 0066]MCD0453482.1 diiron oxygenase [Actinocorallia sp. API 0066]
MTATVLDSAERLKDILDRLVAKSEADYYNPYQLFQWPDTLPQEQYWMSPELMSVHGTEVGAELTEEQLHKLSKWESVNFYSLNVHGIRELITEVIARIHTKEFKLTSEYFHHIIGEENEHMWFFARFCNQYGGKIYPDLTFKFDQASTDGPAAHFLVFARLLLFEEIVDFFNKRMGEDERLDPTIRKVNAIHHQDESRHVAFGRQIVSLLWKDLAAKSDESELEAVRAYLKAYLRRSLESLVNPAAFRDAGIPEPYKARNRVLADPAHADLDRAILKRSVKFLVAEGILLTESIDA